MNRTYLMWLSPYAWILGLRHILYDRGIFRSHTFPFHTICVGNITVGGTGKTPMTEYLAGRFLEKNVTPVVLSRGYGRKTKGFRYVNVTDTWDLAGDEPLQIKRHYPDVPVVVCEDRVEGLLHICKDFPGNPPVILDDAFQHRRVRASKNVLMADFTRPVSKDTLLPFGRLRDLPRAGKRADCVVYTRCSPLQDPKNQPTENLWKAPAYYTYMTYGQPIPLNRAENELREGDTLLLVTGIANPKPLVVYLETSYKVAHHLKFPDHHCFTEKDLEKIRGLLAADPQMKLVTTAKDAVRLASSGIPGWVIPVRISFFSE
ncbi:MAG TPA: tetraacyldisaccharide 4'-kinase, partial [Bacteroidales bacterium]|nr:tetraacyldisaccharide 4'-kinase [Bacteroidales bacterium]